MKAHFRQKRSDGKGGGEETESKAEERRRERRRKTMATNRMKKGARDLTAYNAPPIFTALLPSQVSRLTIFTDL